MQLEEFIDSTRSLLKERIFLGRSRGLETTLTLLVNALEKKEESILASQVSAQVTAGFYHLGSGVKGTDYSDTNAKMSLTEVWSFLYQNLGSLTKNIYKLHFRQKLEEEFKKSTYPEEVQTLWRTVFADQKVPQESRFSHLQSFVEGFEPLDSITNVSLNQLELKDFLRSLPIAVKGTWAHLNNVSFEGKSLEVGVSYHSGNKAFATKDYQIELVGQELTIFDKNNGYNKVEDKVKQASIFAEFSQLLSESQEAKKHKAPEKSAQESLPFLNAKMIDTLLPNEPGLPQAKSNPSNS